MADRDALTVELCDGWTLTAGGIRRLRNGTSEADLTLESPDAVVFHDSCVLNNMIARQDWAKRATGDDRPTAEQIEDGLLKLIPHSQAILQDQQRQSQADGLVELVTKIMDDLTDDVLEGVDLWHDPADEPWATIIVDGHREHWPLKSSRFKHWLARRYYEKAGKTPNANALNDATNVLAGKAVFDGDEHPVYVRLAEHHGRIYLDLADDQWRAVEIDTSGWRIVGDPPVRFRRAAGMLPLPVPESGGRVELLWEHLNVRDEDRPLVLAWLAQALRPVGPYPLLPLYGEQGSAKTTTARALRSLIDPNLSPARSQPRGEEDLMIAASNGWIVVTDNVSHVPTWLSDAYCRLATGGGLSKRQLFTDADETILDAMRPLILTGIEEFVIRGDLLDRSVIVTLPAIPQTDRKPEKAFWRNFNRDRPQIIGALLDRIARALTRIEHVELNTLPRMADFALWGYAAAPKDEDERFLAAYRSNQETANMAMLDSSLVASTLIDFMESRHDWTGTAGDLLEQLTVIAGEERVNRLKVWPKTPQKMRASLDRLKPGLRRAGFDIDFDVPREGGTGARIFEIRRIAT